MHKKTTLLYLIILSISACSGSGSGKRDAEIVYQFARVDCSSYVESFAENKQKLIDNDIKLYSSQCLLTQDSAMLPICDSDVDLAPSSSGGVILNFSTNSLSEDELVSLDAADLDYFLTSSSSGG